MHVYPLVGMFTRKLGSGPEAVTIGGSVPSFVIRVCRAPNTQSRIIAVSRSGCRGSDEAIVCCQLGVSWWPAGCGGDPAGYQRPCLSVLDDDFSEQAVRFTVGSGREDQLAGQGRVSVTEPQAP
jgi:hypothetical protein